VAQLVRQALEAGAEHGAKAIRGVLQVAVRHSRT
jgi:hypothetical protein